MKRPYLLTAELKDWDCTDHDPIDKWVPESEEVLYWLVCHIGRPGEPGADLFTVAVTNYRGMQSEDWRRHRRTAPIRAVEPIVVDPYSWEGVLEAVHARLQKARGRTWPEVWEKLAAMFQWEYEGMR